MEFLGESPVLFPEGNRVRVEARASLREHETALHSRIKNKNNNFPTHCLLNAIAPPCGWLAGMRDFQKEDAIWPAISFATGKFVTKKT